MLKIQDNLIALPIITPADITPADKSQQKQILMPRLIPYNVTLESSYRFFTPIFEFPVGLNPTAPLDHKEWAHLKTGG